MPDKEGTDFAETEADRVADAWAVSRSDFHNELGRKLPAAHRVLRLVTFCGPGIGRRCRWNLDGRDPHPAFLPGPASSDG